MKRLPRTRYRTALSGTLGDRTAVQRTEIAVRFGRDQHDGRLHHRGADHHGSTLVADEPSYCRRTPETGRKTARLRRRRLGVVDAPPSTTLFTRRRTARVPDPVVPDA